MDYTTIDKIIFSEDQVFDNMSEHSVELSEIKTEISSKSEGINKFIPTYNELKRVLEDYLKVYEKDVANLKEATKGYITVDEVSCFSIQNNMYLDLQVETLFQNPIEYKTNTMLDLSNDTAATIAIKDMTEYESE